MRHETIEFWNCCDLWKTRETHCCGTSNFIGQRRDILHCQMVFCKKRSPVSMLFLFWKVYPIQVWICFAKTYLNWVHDICPQFNLDILCDFLRNACVWWKLKHNYVWTDSWWERKQLFLVTVHNRKRILASVLHVWEVCEFWCHNFVTKSQLKRFPVCSGHLRDWVSFQNWVPISEKHMKFQYG